MRRLSWLIREAHRRSLWQVVGFYLAGSWVALQVVQTLTTSLGLPDWVPPVSVALLVAGFPIVAGTALVQEGGPSREVEDDPPTEPTAQEDGDAAAGPASPESGEAVDEPPSSLERLFSWRNALIGGAAAFSLLGVATALYMGSRLLGIGPAAPLVAQGVLEGREPIVLAEFESATGDSLLAITATEALRIDLSQSSVVRLADPDRVRTALRRMGHAPDAPLTRTAARELAVREGIQAVIGGELNRAGGGYMISAQVISADGSILTSHRVTAADSTEILEAIDQLSGALRTKIGESIKSVRSSPPLARVTTTSLEALRKYSQAEHAEQVQGERDRAISLLEEAVGLDSTFAMAWRKLGVILFNQGADRERHREAIRKAYELRDRLTDVESYHAEGAYHLALTEDLQQAITAYENLLQIDPDNSFALNNLGWIYDTQYGDRGRAEHFYREAARADSSDIMVRLNLVEAQIYLGKLDAARATLEQAEQLAGESPRAWLLRLKAALSAMEGRYGAAHAALDRVSQLHGDQPQNRVRTAVEQASVFALRGRVNQAASRVEATIGTLDPVEHRGLYAWPHVWAANLHLHVTGDTSRALELADRVSSEVFLDSIGPGFILALLHIHADAGQPERARAHLDPPRELITDADRMPPRWARDTLVARGAIALSEGRPREALQYFRSVRSERPDRGLFGWLGVAYDRAGVTDSAVTYLGRYLRTYEPDQLMRDSYHRPRFLRRLGELHEERGEVSEALEQYRRYVEMWSDADAELQPRVREVRRRIEALEAQQVAAQARTGS